jgi:hypothetical protein
LCCSLDIFGSVKQTKENEIGGICSIYGGQEKCIQVSVGKPKETRPLRRPRDELMIILKLFLKF